MVDFILCILSLLILFCIYSWIYDTHRFTVNLYDICDTRIKQNVRMVVLSDLHNMQYGPDNQKLLETISRLKPDCILIGGDIPCANPKLDTKIAEKIVSDLVAKYPVYYAFGNHEHRMLLYPDVYHGMGEAYEAFLKESGVKLLRNESILLPSGIRIYGAEIDRFYYKRFGIQNMEDAYMNTILGNVDTEHFSVLLAHNPDYFPQYAGFGADLTISGHVHGGVVRIPWIWRSVASPNIRFFPKYDAGAFFLPKGKKTDLASRKKQRNTIPGQKPLGQNASSPKLKPCQIQRDFLSDQSMLLVSRGLGVHTIPVRVLNPGELIILDFHS